VGCQGAGVARPRRAVPRLLGRGPGCLLRPFMGRAPLATHWRPVAWLWASATQSGGWRRRPAESWLPALTACKVCTDSCLSAGGWTGRQHQPPKATKPPQLWVAARRCRARSHPDLAQGEARGLRDFGCPEAPTSCCSCCERSPRAGDTTGLGSGAAALLLGPRRRPRLAHATPRV
jgi:hypothetical protein